jgi:hypothetical protein
MQQSYPQEHELAPVPHSLPQSTSLAERLDPAIGEATSVLGAVVTELMRRSLRGGVMRIGDELNGYVGEQVDLVIANRTPVLEQLASTVADKTARLAATEVAAEETRALEQRTVETSRQLSVQIEATGEAARQSTAEAARTLAARIAEAEKQAHEKTLAAAQELTGKIDETGKRTLEAAEARLAAEARERAQQIETAEKRIETAVRAELLQANEALSVRVAELEKPRGLRALFLRLFGRRNKVTGG